MKLCESITIGNSTQTWRRDNSQVGSALDSTSLSYLRFLIFLSSTTQDARAISLMYKQMVYPSTDYPTSEFWRIRTPLDTLPAHICQA